jgi:MarR family transcriptional regulator, transcriptional regulator for hemolysin
MNIQRRESKKFRQAGGAQAKQLAALTRELSRCCLDKEERICRTFGLHAADGRVLTAISTEGLETATALAERLGIGNSRLTPLIDRLEKKGFVARAEAEGDRRVRQLTLTESGRTVAARVQSFETHLHQELLSRFPEAERAQLLETLRHLKTAMDEIRQSIEFE